MRYFKRLDFLLISVFATILLILTFFIIDFFRIPLPQFTASKGGILAVSPLQWSSSASFGEPRARTAWVILFFICAIGDVGVLALIGRSAYRCLIRRRSDLCVPNYSFGDILSIIKDRALVAFILLTFSFCLFSCVAWFIVSELSIGEKIVENNSHFLETLIKGTLGSISNAKAVALADFLLNYCFPFATFMLAITISAISIGIPATASSLLFEKLPDFIDDVQIAKANDGRKLGSGPPASSYDVLVYTQGERFSYLKRLMYASAALESLSIASLSAFFSWITSGSSANALLVGQIGQLYVVRFSGLCTAGLMVLYIPTVMILSSRANKLQPYFSGGSIVPYATRQLNMRSVSGIDLGAFDHLGVIASSFLPLATGTASAAVVSWF